MDNETLDLFISKVKLLKCDFVTVKGDLILGSDEDLAHLSIISHTEPKFWDLEGIVFRVKDLTKVDGISFDILYKSINQILRQPPTVQILNLQDDEQMKTIMAKKADDGISMININDYIMSINKSLIPLNKSDKLDLNIRDHGNTFSGEYIITRGKNIIKKYYLYLKL